MASEAAECRLLCVGILSACLLGMLAWAGNSRPLYCLGYHSAVGVQSRFMAWTAGTGWWRPSCS